MDYVINILIYVLLYAVVAQSLNFILGSLGIVSMCHAVFCGIGAYSSAPIASNLGWNFFAGAAVGFLISFVIGCLLAATSLRVQDEYLIVLTVGFQMVMFEFFLTARGITKGQGGIADIPAAKFAGLSFDTSPTFLAFLIVVTIVIFAMTRWLFFSPFGRVLKAIREDETAARSLGKNTLAFKVFMFGLSGGIAAVGGSLLAHYVSYITPANFSVDMSVSLLVMVILGGAGNFWGPLIGAAVLVGLPEALRFIPSSGGYIDSVREILYGLILMFAMIYRPQGLLPEYAATSGGQSRERGGRRQGESLADRDPVVAVEASTDDGQGMPILEVTGVSKSFGGLAAVSNASLSLPAAEVTGLIGPNGCGKTTLFNLISGHIRPDNGQIKVSGKEYTRIPAYTLPKYGVVRSWQDGRVFQEMSVLDNVLVACPGQSGENPLFVFLKFATVAAEERANRVKAMRYLEQVGLDHKAGELVKNLSAAEQKLVALARLLATECPVLMLDEPTAALDLESVDRIKKLIKSLVLLEKKTILLVEHNLDIVKDLVSRAYFMSNGEILAYEKPAVLMQDKKLTEVYFGTD